MTSQSQNLQKQNGQKPDQKKPERPGPRPLPLHMAMEGWVLQMAMAGLYPLSSNASTLWNADSPSSNPGKIPDTPVTLLQQLLQNPASAKNPEGFDPVRFVNAVAAAGSSQMEGFMRGVRAYRAHPFRRSLAAPPAMWERGSARLHDYGGDPSSPPVLFVPSLINRAYILDLAPDRSVIRTVAQTFHAFLLDWGEPGATERRYDLTAYVTHVLIPALEQVKRTTGQTPRVVGYCLGGTLAVAPAVLRPDLVAVLVLLAAPWDFQADAENVGVMLKFSRPLLEVMLRAEGVASVDLLQALFAALDPSLVGRKFRSFTQLDPASDEAQRFVALEDWLNDGVPLAGPVAEETLFRWYGDNAPARLAWKIGGAVIDPRKITCPALAFIPRQDRIVPPASAAALARAIPGTETRAVDLGHIGMVAGGRAPAEVYGPLADWLKAAGKQG